MMSLLVEMIMLEIWNGILKVKHVFLLGRFRFFTGVFGRYTDFMAAETYCIMLMSSNSFYILDRGF